LRPFPKSLPEKRRDGQLNPALDVDRKPSRGLFAVGNDAASIFGGSYPGAGATLGPAMTFGYICWKNLAEKRAAD
jgi:hypothetical protein